MSFLVVGPMTGEIRLLFTDGPVELEKWPAHIEHFEQIAHLCRRIYRIYRTLMNVDRGRSLCNRLDLASFESELILPKDNSCLDLDLTCFLGWIGLQYCGN